MTALQAAGPGSNPAARSPGPRSRVAEKPPFKRSGRSSSLRRITGTAVPNIQAASASREQLRGTAPAARMARGDSAKVVYGVRFPGGRRKEVTCLVCRSGCWPSGSRQLSFTQEIRGSNPLHPTIDRRSAAPSSSSGRMPDLDSGERGSNPWLGTSLAFGAGQVVRPLALNQVTGGSTPPHRAAPPTPGRRR